MGYNHNAQAPGWNAGGYEAAIADIWIDAGGDAEFVADVHVGELNLKDLGIEGIVLAVYNSSGNLVAWVSEDIDNISYDISLHAILPGISLNHTYTCKLWFVSDLYEFDESQIVARVPNLTDYSVSVKVKQISEWRYDGDGHNVPAPWVQLGGDGMNWNTGYFNIGVIMSNQGFDNVKIYARLFDWNYNLIGEGEIYNDVSYPMTEISGSAYLGMQSIPSHGYHVNVYFEYTVN
jgi:hypothetical protein